MSMSLTAKQAELLAYIETHTTENKGVAPSFQEMQDALGLKSKSGVHRLITALEERRRIIRRHNRARAIEVISQDAPPANVPALHTFPTHMLIAELARRSHTNRKAA